MDPAVTFPPPPSPRNLYLYAWIPSLLWVAVIILESTSLGSSEHTALLLRWILGAFLPHLSAAGLEVINHYVRKCGHFTGYGLLSLFFLRTWWVTLWLRRRPGVISLPRWRCFLSSWRLGAASLAVLSTAVIASLDEWHQTFLPSRTGTWRDVVLDTMAAIFVQCLILVCSDLRVGAKKRQAVSTAARA